MNAVKVSRAVNASAEDIAQHRGAKFAVAIKILGTFKGNIEVVTCDPEHSRGKSADPRLVALLGKARPVDPLPVFARPDADVADLTNAESAVDEVLVGVEQEVEEVVVRRHRCDGHAVVSRVGLGREGIKAEKFGEGGEGIALKKVAVELDEDAVLAAETDLAVVGEGCFVGHESARLQEETAVLELGGGDVEVLVAARTKLGMGIERAADDALDDDGVESRIRHRGPEPDEGGGHRDLRGNAAKELGAAVDAVGNELAGHRREDHVPELVVVSQPQDPPRIKLTRALSRLNHAIAAFAHDLPCFNHAIRKSRTQQKYEIVLSSCQLGHSWVSLLYKQEIVIFCLYSLINL